MCKFLRYIYSITRYRRRISSRRSPRYKMEKMEQRPLLGTSTKKSLSWLPLHKSLLKPFFMFCGITLVICAFYLQRNSIIDNGNILRYDRLLPRHKSTKQSSSSVTIKKENRRARRPGKRFSSPLITGSN